VDRSETIVKEVNAALERDPRISFHKHPLKIAVDPDGTLFLEGELENIAAKKLALEHAAAIGGVIGIVDRLRIAPSIPMGDGEIRDHVRNALLEEPAINSCGIRIMNSGRWEIFRESQVATPRCSIEVTVGDGVVTLDGQVSSLSHKRLAGVLAWWVPGSRDVVNGLEVAPIQEDSDDEIAEAVKLVLEKDPLINAYRIHVTVRAAVVTLEGLVVNNAESEMAEMDAWYVFGVDRVVNRLEHER
jgi:osmotically-inducible protein OsmY